MEQALEEKPSDREEWDWKIMVARSSLHINAWSNNLTINFSKQRILSTVDRQDCYSDLFWRADELPFVFLISDARLRTNPGLRVSIHESQKLDSKDRKLDS